MPPATTPTTGHPTTSLRPAPARRGRHRAAVLLLASALTLATAACGSRTPDAVAPAPSSTTLTGSPTTATTTDPGRTASTASTTPGVPTSAPPPTAAGGPTTTGRPPTTFAGVEGNDPEGNPIPSTPTPTFPPTAPTSALPAGSAAYCTKVGDALAALDAAILASESGGDSSLDTVKARWAALTSSPPDAISADVKVLSAKIGGAADASSLASLDQDPAVVTATEHLAAWVKPNCGFDPANPTA